ncbi:MAG: GNAT family N-acetyltransferase [Novosphingobium sp.]
MHQWHRGFAGANLAVAPRSYDFFESLAWDGCVWTARSDEGEIRALAYSAYDEEAGICEIGGLMVDLRYRGCGLGSTVARLALCHSLVSENLLAREGTRIIARVFRAPQQVAEDAGHGKRFKIIEDVLKFHHAGERIYQNNEIDGLTCEDGFFVVDEYQFSVPETLVALAKWAREWTGFVGNNIPALIDFHENSDMALWSATLDRMVREVS